MPYADFEGRRIAIEQGDTVASALYRAGVRTFSRSFKYHRPRGLYCLTGDCPNCLLTVDGEPAVRACVTPATDGQRIERGRGWPSADRDVFSGLWQVRRLLPVGFYYKTLVRPRVAWRLAEPLIRRLTGLGALPLDLGPAHREAEHHHDDLVVIGAGVAGLAAAQAGAEAGASVLLADEGTIGEKLPAGPMRDRVEALLVDVREHPRITVLERAAAVGIYEGPLVPIAGEERLHLVHPDRVIVATGATERHGVFAGNDLPGVWLGRGASRLAGVHGVRPGETVVLVGETDETLDHHAALVSAGTEIAACAVPERLVSELPEQVRVIPNGRVVAARGRRRVKAAVLASDAGQATIPCDALVISLGLVPRDGLLRQADGLPVVGAGEVLAPGCTVDEAIAGARSALGAEPSAAQIELPGAATAGFACLCEDVGVTELQDAWDEGFRSTELLKRYTTATMGPLPGGALP